MMRRVLIVAVLLIGLAAGSVCAQDTGDGPSRSKKTASGQPPAATADSLFREALEAYRANQLGLAVTKLKAAHQLAPADINVRLTLGLALYETDAASMEAQQLMESVAGRFRNNKELQLKLLDSYLQHNLGSKITSLLDELRVVKANDTRFAFDVVYAVIRYGQLKVAQQELDVISDRLLPVKEKLTEAELKTPANQSLRHDLGEVYFMRGMMAASRDEKAEAMSLFQAADRHDFPARDSLQMQMLAEALSRLGEDQLSAQAYAEYLKYFPDDAAARMQLAIAQYALGLFATTRDSLQRVIELAPKMEKVHLYLGLTLLELKSNDDAQREFQLELEGDPKSHQAMAGMAYLAYLGGDNDRCLDWLRKAQALNQDWVETNMVFGLLHNRLGQFALAIPFLERVIKERPAYSRAHYQLSLAYRRSGDEAKAKEHSDLYERLISEEKARQLGDRVP